MLLIKILYAAIFAVWSAYFCGNLQSTDHMLASSLNNQCKPPAGRFSVLMESEAAKEEMDLTRQGKHEDIHLVRSGLRATDCTEGPIWKEGFEVGTWEGPFNVGSNIENSIQNSATDSHTQLIYQEKNDDDEDHDVQFERNCAGNPSRSDLRRNCSRSFVVWSAHAPGDGMVEVKCGERMMSGRSTGGSPRHFTGLVVMVAPDGGVVAPDQGHGIISVWTVGNGGEVQNGVLAVFPNIHTCALDSGASDRDRQPRFFRSGIAGAGKPTLLDVETLDFSTPELKLLASAITTRSREERLRAMRDDLTFIPFLMLDFQTTFMSAAATGLTYFVQSYNPFGPRALAANLDSLFVIHCFTGMLHVVSLSRFHALADFADESGEGVVSIVLHVFFVFHVFQWIRAGRQSVQWILV